jgi:hypothetical protein
VNLLTKCDTLVAKMENNISILAAWALWSEGHLPEHVLLWGQPIYFWERVGKILEFIGALVVIIDLLGPERIRRLGEKLKIYSDNPVVAIQASWRYLFRWLSVPFLLIAFFSFWTHPQDPAYDFQLPSFLHITLPRVLSVAFGIVGLAGALWVSFVAFYTVLGITWAAGVAYGLARVLDRENADWWLKLFWLTFLLVGFHFDLLTS